MALNKVEGEIGSAYSYAMASDNQAVSDISNSIGKTFKKTLTYKLAAPGNNEINQIFTEKFTVAASTTKSINIQDGSLKNIYGDTIAFAKVKHLAINILENSESSTVKIQGNFITLNFGTGAEMLILPTGSGMEFFNRKTGFDVDVTNARDIDIVNNDGSNAITFEIVISGVKE